MHVLQRLPVWHFNELHFAALHTFRRCNCHCNCNNCLWKTIKYAF